MIANPNREETQQQREQQMSEAKSRAGWQPATYYPDPAIHALDPRFEKYWLKLSAVERLTTGLRWAEGPVWFGDVRYLLCSDIPNNRIIKWEEETGAVSIYRKPSNFANGHTRDRQGRLITCEHGGRRVTRTEHDGSITVLIDSFGGKRLNSPNDVVVKSDGSIWFTDPTFGLLGNYEGYRIRDRRQCLPDRRLDRKGLYRRRRRARSQRVVLLAGRENPLHRGIPRRAEPQDPGL
jgi:SMP-30/Gluconolactonase/LRE-like region